MKVRADRHHILHERVEWTARQQAADLRERPELVPRIDRSVHEELHRIAPAVPLLGYYALCRVNKLYEPVPGDTIASMDNLLFAIEDAGKHPKAHRVERAIAGLAIEALEIQRAVLRGNVDIGRSTVIDLAAYNSSRNSEQPKLTLVKE